MNKEKKSIVVVDDNPVTQELLKKILENNHYQVVQCFDANECLIVIQKNKPAAILMDVILPDINGKEVAQRIMDDPNNADIALIFTTNTVNLKDDKGYQTFDINGQTYRAFAKPLHNQKLISTIRKEINRKIHGGNLPKQIKGSTDD